jgi:transcriptional regulator with XRE-family HTH domain
MTAGSGESLRVGALLRAARHRADLSQRKLSGAAGVDRSVVAKIEAAMVRAPGFPMMVRLLAAAGCRLVVVDADGVPLPPRPYDDALDAGHRRWPAHLDVRPVRTERDWWYGKYLTDMPAAACLHC